MARERLRHPRAIVSGQAGVVVIIHGPIYTYRRIGDQAYHVCRREDVPYLFADASDVITISGRSPEQVYRILEHEAAQDRALHLMLILIDRSAHLRAKTLAADTLEDLLAGSTTKAFVLHRLYARPLPPSADLPDALRCCADLGQKNVWALLGQLKREQPIIASVRERWEHLDPLLFETAKGKQVYERIAIEEGIFFTICRHPEQITADIVERWVNYSRSKDAAATGILNAWISTFVSERKPVAMADQLELFTEGHQRVT